MLAISKTVYLTLSTLTPNSLIEELQKTQKTFIWHSSGPKIGNLENCGLKHVDTPLKIVSLQCSWLQKLHDENFREWKAIPSHFTFKFNSCLSFGRKVLSSTKTFCFSGVALFFRTTCLFVFCQIFCGLINIFYWRKVHLFFVMLLIKA